MLKKLMTLVLLSATNSLFALDGYNTGRDFKIDYSINAHGDQNFADFQALGAQSVLSGMDFDGDSLYEILFNIDETLAPGGPDPGKLGCYLYESDGNGGYNLVWHFITPDPGNSLPGMTHGDIDADGLHEIYFGVPPAVGSNDNTWGTYIFEQNQDGSFPATPTLLFQYGMTSADNFRPAGFAIGDVDGDGKHELCSVDRGQKRLSIDALTGAELNNFASFTNEFISDTAMSGGSIYDVDIIDFNDNGMHEVWVNTWDNFSMAVFEAEGTDTYTLKADFDGLYADADPASFNRDGFLWNDADKDGDMDAWFPMTNGVLYYLENGLDPYTMLPQDSIHYVDDIDEAVAYEAPSGVTMSGQYQKFSHAENGYVIGLMMVFDHKAVDTSGVTDQIKVVIKDAGTTGPGATIDSMMLDIAQIDTTGAGNIMELAEPMFSDGSTAEPNEFFVGIEWEISATTQDTFALLADTSAASTDGPGSFYKNSTDGSHVAQDVDLAIGVITLPEMFVDLDSLHEDHFSEVLVFGERSRGADLGDIDADGKPDIIATTGTKETVVRMEFMGGDPTDESRYDVSVILESKGEPGDRYYPLSISENDLDGDGKHEVVLTNLYAANATQPQIIVLEHDPYKYDVAGGNEVNHLAPGWTIAAVSKKTAVDSLFGSDPTGNSRSVIGGMDMDQDGAKEVIATDYAGQRVIVYEYDAANNAFDVVWHSPVPDSVRHAYNPRTIGVGDLDGDGKHEIVFPSSDHNAEGWHIYEWDGVTGSDNYGTTFSSVCQVEIDTCCAGDGAGTDSYGTGFRGDHHTTRIADVDGDGQQELIIAIRRGAPRGTMVVSLAEGDDIVHNSGGGFETWNTELHVDQMLYGGGSPLDAVPADLDGDGHHEIVNHTWNNFNIYNIGVSGPDTYDLPDPDAIDRHYKATSNDQYSIWGGRVKDIDADGNDEVFFSSMGSWGVGSGDVYVVDYDEDDDVLAISDDHVRKIGTNVGQFIGAVGDGGYDNNRQTLFVGYSGNRNPNISAMEYIGPEPGDASSYLTKPIYFGELDVANVTTTIDSTSDTTAVHSYKWGFPSKIRTSWDGESLDFDGDNKKELLVSFQSVPDSLTHTTYAWNSATMMMDTTVTRVVNEKSWTFIILESGNEQLASDDPIAFLSPEDYKLEQNYPNPFNPNTTIEYTVPINRRVTVNVYNINGQLVRTLVDNKMVNAGTHRAVWHGKNNLGRQVSTGMYLYSLEWAGMKKVKRMTLVK